MELELKKTYSIDRREICGKRDLNPRTPTRLDSKSSAFNQTWQFPRKYIKDLLIGMLYYSKY